MDSNIERRGRPSGISYTKAAIASDDLYGYLASCAEVQPKAQSILAKYGYEQATTETELAHKLSSLVMNVGESALKDIAMIHPDKELILALASPRKVSVQTEEKLNDCGCGGNHEKLHDCGCGGSKTAAPAVSLNDTGGAQYFALQPAPVFETNEKINQPIITHNVYLIPAIVVGASILISVVLWKKL
jgi:hypothetical protein